MKKLLSVLMVIVLSVGCSYPMLTKIEYRRILPAEAQEIMINYDVLILDVRTQQEFAGGHIPNAVLLPYIEIRATAENVISDRTRIILVYCQSGRRSEIAARTLIELGFVNVFDFGGINAWTGEIAQ